MELPEGSRSLRNMLKGFLPIILWGLFFASSIFGHVALKRGAGKALDYSFHTGTTVFLSPWGIAALFSWTFSCWLWAVLLTRHSLFEANSVSTLRYVFICIASFFLLKESFTARDVAGMAFISIGVWLISRD